MAVVLRVGLSARLSRAEMVLVGAVEPFGVVRAKRVPHGEPSPGEPPTELMQVARMLAIVSIWATGMVVPVGTLAPGDAPVAVFTNSDASVNALANSVESLVPDPIAAGDVMNGASEYTAPEVYAKCVKLMLNPVFYQLLPWSLAFSQCPDAAMLGFFRRARSRR